MKPLTVGALAGGALALASFALTIAFGWADGSAFELEFWRGPRGWFDAVLAGLFGWAIGSGEALQRGARRDLEALRPALGPGSETRTIGPLPMRARIGTALAGALLGLAVNFAPGNWPEGLPRAGDPFFLWSTLRTVLVSWAIVRTGVIATRLATRFSRLGPSLRIDDLLDLSPLAPLGRGGLRNVAVWVGFSVLFAVMLIAPFGRSIAAINITISVAVGLAAFLAPVRGAHDRLVEARDAELARVRAALLARTASRDAVAEASDARFSALSLADLLAWESRVERVRTWPFDGSTLLRFGLYVAIGLGSWVGAALVERALGAAFG